MPDRPKARTGKGPTEGNLGSLDTLMPSADLAEQETLVVAKDEHAETIGDIEIAATADSGENRGPKSSPARARQGTGTLCEVPRSHYHLQSELARGGMGRIVRAQDKRLGRLVAIKELLKNSPMARARFEREALITARLQHPAIVPLYEAGRWPDGEPFFAMKMVAGKPLDEVVRERKTLALRLALLPRVIDVADALAYAHAEGVIHRDLKPANVLVGDFGETVVIDWGLAKRVGVDEGLESLDASDLEAGGDAALTVMGQAMGTPAYMPPEQARGEDVDKRADVYSLGAMLYHVLAGKMAYSSSKSVQEVLSRVLKGPPESLASISSGIPADLLTIVNKAMARDPEQRYENAAAFADELRRFEAGKLVAAHSYSFTSLLWRWIRKYRSSVAISLFLLACLAAFAVWSFQELRGERDQATRARQQAITERMAAVAKSRELALGFAASLAVDAPIESLRELAAMDLNDEAIGSEQAREIAAQARSSRITQELTAAGSDHGMVALSPDASLLAIVWHDQQVALLDLKTRALTILAGPVLDRPRALSFSSAGGLLAIADGDRNAYLWELDGHAPSNAEPMTIRSTRNIEQLLLSPDERWVAIRSGSTIEILDREKGLDAERQVVNLYSSSDMCFSPDSKSLAVAGDLAIIYGLETGQEIEIMAARPNEDTVSKRESFVKVLYSPDGKELAFADERVFIFDVETKEAALAFEATGRISALSFSDDSKMLAAGSHDTIVYLYRLHALGSPLHTLTGHDQELNWLAFAEGDHSLVSAGEGGQLRLWQLSWLEQGNLLWSTSSEVLSMTLDERPPLLSADGKLILAYDRSKVLRLWHRERPDLRTLGTELWRSRSLFATGTTRMVWSTGSTDYRVWLAPAQGVSTMLGDHGEQVEIVAISKDDRYAASAGATRLVLWDLTSGESRELEGHSSNMRHMAFTDSGLVSVDFRHGQIYRWDVQTATGKLVGEHGDMLSMAGIAVDPRGRWVATAGMDRQVFVHRLDGTGDKKLLAIGERPIAGMAVSADGRCLAMSLRKGEVSVFYPLEEREATLLRSPENMEDLVHPVFSPDGRELAATNRVTGLRVWKDWSHSKESVLLRGQHESWFPAFSPDGTRIVAAGKPEGAASIWQVATGQRRDLQSPEETSRAAFWPASRSIVVSSWGGVVYVWSDDLPTRWPDLKAWIDQQIADHATPVQAR